jgi:glycosyltransferase involved in cell wall biosynthesis
MKIALIFTGDPNEINGRFMNVRNRVKYLHNHEKVDLNVFLIRIKSDCLVRLFTGRKKQKKEEKFSMLDDVEYENFWINYSFAEAVFRKLIGYRDIICKSQIEDIIPMFFDYDMILAHSLEGKYIAYHVKEKFRVPYINGWHGSDLNVDPYPTKKIFRLHQQLIAAADYNLFVSKNLMEKSNEFTKTTNKGVSYSGVPSSFRPFEQSLILQLKEKYNLSCKYIVGFVGNLRPIKNVLILPEIFKILQSRLIDVGFVIVGDGEQSNKMKHLVDKLGVRNVSFMGDKLTRDEIPQIMNCFNVLILPSLNEGLPLVTLEALACSIPVVGSKVGGISESIGEENTFELNEKFADNISNRILEIIENEEKPQMLADIFSWDKTINNLVELCEEIISR